MDISSQNEGKIYMPDPPYQHDGKIYVPQSSTVTTPAWSAATPYLPPSQLASYGPLAPYKHTGTFPPHDSPSEEERTICGLRKTTFILSVIIAILVLALALGLGLGLGLDRNKEQNGTSLGANQTSNPLQATDAPTNPTTSSSPAPNNNNDNPTATVVTVSQTVTTLPTVLALDCPSPATPSPTIRLEGPAGKPVTTFAMNCGQDNSGFDIMNTLAYSLDDCMRACAMYNVFSKPLRCTGVQFWRPIASAKRSWDGNCFLKNGTVSKIENKDSGQTVWASIV
ncbi:hypothetical protein QBC44DRAFT_360352 [Cladorrhinum sp. PSN332]|nr:hypothetical protein QBC44DRAFT_360352 [Cladorrhinum sp. PSN332]